jgi:hypothetical protein
MDEQDQPSSSLLPDDFEAAEDSLPTSHLSFYDLSGLHDLENTDPGLLQYFWTSPMGNNEHIESTLDQPADSVRVFRGRTAAVINQWLSSDIR